ncbi:MAG TPA: universal stress protein [Kofleriaceae bacterium]|nr:universal stress protein [Kofleriaceae bacterium]
MLPKNILVPTDLSEGAEEALDYACELAAQFGATVHLLNVIGIPTLGVPELGIALTSTMIDSMVKDNQEALEKLGQSRRSCAHIGQVLLRTGDARDTITSVAKEIGADLIVMSTHGRRGVTRALLGSVTEAIVRSAPCPVLTIHPHTARHNDEKAA